MCISKIIIISDKGLSPGRRQAITWINAGIFLIVRLGFIHFHSRKAFENIVCKMASIKSRPQSVKIESHPCLPLVEFHFQLSSSKLIRHFTDICQGYHKWELELPHNCHNGKNAVVDNIGEYLTGILYRPIILPRSDFVTVRLANGSAPFKLQAIPPLGYRILWQIAIVTQGQDNWFLVKWSCC